MIRKNVRWTSNVRWASGTLLFVVMFTVAAPAQETTIRPVQPGFESFFVVPKAEFDAKVADWAFYNVMYEDWEKLPVELTTSRPAKPVHIGQCGNSSGAQQQTAKLFGHLADVYSYWAFLYTSNDKPAEDTLIWPGVNNPFLNHARRMRELVGDAPIVAHLHGNVAKGKEQRSASLEEIQWQFFAAAGCGYRGVLWPDGYENADWGEELKQIAEKASRHGRFLGKARSVDWAKADKGQPISALACDEYLFVFLLHPAYMKFGDNGKTVTIPLNKPSCEGTVTITLPKRLEIRRGQMLEGKTLRLIKQDVTTMIQYSFTSGGEMLIFTLTGKAEQADVDRPVTQSADIEPAVMAQ